MAENRMARDLENREAEKRPQAWLPPQILPEPKPIPGYGFRWIRISLMGTPDVTNVSGKLREGWEPCKAVDHPEMEIYTDPHSKSRFKDNIEVGGLLLCKAPVEMLQQRDAYYAQQASTQMQSVDSSLMRVNDPRMPLFNERSGEVKFGRGSK